MTGTRPVHQPGIIILLLLLLCCAPRIQSEEVFITIGGGDVTGVYFPAGLAIAKLLNQRRSEYGIRAAVEATTGSTFNLNAIAAGYMEFGLIQSDLQHEAVNGRGRWAQKGPQTDLRCLFSVHDEAVTLVAAVDAGVSKVADLNGKRVSTGNPGSSQHRIVIEVLESAHLNPETDLQLSKVQASDAPKQLQDDHIDAFFFTVGHPNEMIREALTSDRDARVIPIVGQDLEQLIAGYTPYTSTRIPVMHLYPEAGRQEDVVTLGVKATLCTSSKVPEAVVYAVTKEVFENLEVFRQQHPAFRYLTREGMLEGLTAPLHRGAIRYFNESGLVK